MLLMLLLGCPDPNTCDLAAPADGDEDGFDCTVDCDDGAASVYPGAPEACDAIDQDCDGASLADGACGVDVEISAVGEAFPYDDSTVGDLSGELAGGAGADLLVLDRSTDDIHVVDGRVRPEDLAVSDSDWYAVLSTTAGSGTVSNSSADINGDGHDDLVFVDSFSLTGAHVLFGPFSATGVREVHDDDLTWAPYGVSDQGDWLYQWGFEDLDGVPGAEMFGAERGEDAVFSVWSVTAPGEPVRRVLPPSDGGRLIEDVRQIDDLDGDGVDEVIVYVTVGADDAKLYQLQALAGGEIWAAGDGAPTDALALWSLDAVREDEIGLVTEADSFASLGDVDADGVNDLLVAGWRSTRPDLGSGEALVLSGAIRGAIDLHASVQHSFVAGADCEGFGKLMLADDAGGPVSPVADFDGDGSPDLAFDACGVDAIAPLRPEGLLAPLEGLRFTENAGVLDIADLDQDGMDDMLVLDRDTGVRYIWRGWAIPWDEPQWW